MRLSARLAADTVHVIWVTQRADGWVRDRVDIARGAGQPGIERPLLDAPLERGQSASVVS